MRSLPLFVSGSALDKINSSLAGGKGSSLAKIRSFSFETPPFSVVTTEAFKRVTQNFQAELDEWLKEMSEGKLNAGQVEANIKDRFESSELPPEIMQNLKLWITDNRLTEASFAVRSSVMDEDGEKHSFAGQMESHLYQENLSDIEACILKVMASAFSERSLMYRERNGLDLKGIACAVVIQKMIDPEVSGVLFTKNPRNGISSQYHVSAAFGVGEGVVSGNADCDEWTFDWKTQTFESEISEKLQMTVRASTGVGTEVKEVSSERSQLPCLNDLQLRALIKRSKQLRDAYRADIDIEWAIEGSVLYFLQARPITATASSAGVDKMVFDNSNIQESFCGITLPLTFSFASEAYFYVYSQLMKEMNFSDSEIRRQEDRHRRMLAYINGRVYYNIESWYLGLKFLPSFGKNKKDMERMMGVEHPVEFVHDLELSTIQKAKVLPQLLLIAFKLGYKFSTIDRLKNKFETWFERSYPVFESADIQSMTERELLSQIVKTKAHFLENWGIPLINDFYVMTSNGQVYRTLDRINMKTEGPKLLFGEKLESTEPTKRIIAIVEKISRFPQIISTLMNANSGRDFIKAIAAMNPEISADIQAYIYDYGDRVAGELKLESISLHQNPEFFVEILKSYVESQIPSLQAFEIQELNQRILAEGQVFNKVRSELGHVALFAFKRQLRSLRKGIVYRESMRMARTRVFGLFRKYYSELGAKWAQRGVIENARDIFYLTENEISDLMNARSVIIDPRKQIELRQRSLEDVANVEPPAHFSAATPVVQGSELKVPSANGKIVDSLRGLGCFPGKVCGEVRVVLSPEEIHPRELDDKILVAMRTDPGWAPLFMNLKGLIVEKGSTLSHSAIVARELQIPTVVGVPGITKTLKNGEWVMLNGESGELERRSGNDTTQSHTELN